MYCNNIIVSFQELLDDFNNNLVNYLENNVWHLEHNYKKR